MSRRAAAEAWAQRQAQQIGAEVVVVQATLGLSNRRLALLAGVALSTVRRVHQGDGSVQLDTLTRVTAALGLDLSLRVFPGRQPSLRDSGQLRIANAVRVILHPAWRPALEVQAGEHGRSADLVCFGPTEILHVEIERVLLDFQAQYRPALRKREWLAERHERPVRLILAVEDTRRNKRAVTEHDSIIREIFPAGSREILQSIRTGRPLGRDGLLWVRPGSLNPAPG